MLNTLAVQRALSHSGQPLPPLPNVGRVAERHNDWDEYYVPPHRRVTGVGIDPGFDIGSEPVEEDEQASPRNSSTPSPPHRGSTTTSPRNRDDDVHGRPGERSQSVGATPRGTLSDRHFRGVWAEAGRTGRRASEPPEGANKRHRRGNGLEPDIAPTRRERPPEPVNRDANRRKGSRSTDTYDVGNRTTRSEAAGQPLRQGIGRGRGECTRCGGGCSEPVSEEHRVVQLPCGHPVHARCVLSNLERRGEHSPKRIHPRHETRPGSRRILGARMSQVS